MTKLKASTKMLVTNHLRISSRGFTLMELMIVIAIIGILIAIAIPSYQIYLRRARFTEIVQAVGPYKVAVEECFQRMGTLEACSSGHAGIPPAILSGEGVGLVDQIQVETGGKITVTPRALYGITAQDTYILIAHTDHDALIWQAEGGAVQHGYVS